MAKKKVELEEEGEEQVVEKKQPKKKAAKKEPVEKKESRRPMSVGGIIDKGPGKARDWEAKAPWNRKSHSTSRFERRIGRTSND